MGVLKREQEQAEQRVDAEEQRSDGLREEAKSGQAGSQEEDRKGEKSVR
jgi:hypothetical protein